MSESNHGQSDVRKAAILIRSLDKQLAAQVMAQLPPGMLKKVTTELSQKEMYPAAEAEAVLEEFFELAADLTGERRDSRESAQADSSEADRPSPVSCLPDPVPTIPFQFLNSLPLPRLVELLDGEHPQTIALVLSYLPGEIVTDVLTTMSREQQSWVSASLASLGAVNPEVLKLLENHLQARLCSPSHRSAEAGSVRPLNRHPDQHDPVSQTVERPHDSRSRPSRISFQTIWDLDRQALTDLVKSCGPDVLGCALQGVEPARRKELVERLAPPAREQLAHVLETAYPIRLDSIHEAQQSVIAAMAELRGNRMDSVQGNPD